jgi:hypothetical protein
LEATAKNESKDRVWDKFKDLANMLLSPRWQSYVEREGFEKLVNGSESRRRLTVFSVLKPHLRRLPLGHNVWCVLQGLLFV